MPARVGAVVLAAGSAVRFGAVKLLAPLDGRPLLQHVLDAAADAALEPIVVVTGRAAADIERAIAWRNERRVVNPRPEAGLSGSLRVGLAAVAAIDPSPDAVLVLLGDQPRVRADILRRLAAEPLDPDRPIVVPAYAGGGDPNPARIERPAWPLARGLTGDRGMGPLIASRAELVRAVAVTGFNPDVDTRADLEALAADG